MLELNLLSLPKTYRYVREELPVLYAKTKTGALKWYKIAVTHYQGSHSEIERTKASKIGGKPQTDITEITSGVNIGKANETTIVEQARFVATSMFNRLKDKGYKTLEDYGVPDEAQLIKLLKDVTENTDAQGFKKPMLAQKYVEGIAEYPFCVQPKLNGARCLAVCTEEGVKLLSRSGKQYFNENIERELNKVMKPGMIFDGEIYQHGETLQGIISKLKRQKEVHPEAHKLRYVVYDYPSVNGVYQQRWKAFLKVVSAYLGVVNEKCPLEFIQNKWVDNKEQFDKLHAEFIGKGYEGTMVRTDTHNYEFGYRSKSLLKRKDMQDDEFKIVGYKEARGRNKGTVVFRCATKDREFDVVPEGSMEYKAELFKNAEKYIGKMLTVRYQELSEDGVPIFPVGVAIRDYE